ncbi:MAG: hypothetical protein ACHBN1_01785 [Heteroscytonema crispum UTEX LB 1556]
MAIALPDPSSSRMLLKRALAPAPRLDVIARSRSAAAKRRSHGNSEIDILTQMGAKEVVQPEFEAALELGAHLLATLAEVESHIRNVFTMYSISKYLIIRP